MLYESHVILYFVHTTVDFSKLLESPLNDRNVSIYNIIIVFDLLQFMVHSFLSIQAIGLFFHYRFEDFSDSPVNLVDTEISMLVKVNVVEAIS